MERSADSSQDACDTATQRVRKVQSHKNKRALVLRSTVSQLGVPAAGLQHIGMRSLHVYFCYALASLRCCLRPCRKTRFVSSMICW